MSFLFFFFNDTATTEIYTLSYTTLFRSGSTWPGRLRATASAPPESPIASGDRKSTRLNSSHTVISYAVFCLKKKNEHDDGEDAAQVTEELGAQDVSVERAPDHGDALPPS